MVRKSSSEHTTVTDMEVGDIGLRTTLVNICRVKIGARNKSTNWHAQLNIFSFMQTGQIPVTALASKF